MESNISLLGKAEDPAQVLAELKASKARLATTTLSTEAEVRLKQVLAE